MPKIADAKPMRRSDLRTKISDGVIQQIKEMIKTRKPGTRLPTERDLCRMFGVSRASVREALKTLTNMGILETRHGSGSQVADSSTKILKTSFELLVILDQPTIDEMYDTRELIEVFLVERAALQRSDEEVTALQRVIADFKETINDPDATMEADMRFHEIIAAAARVRILERFIECLRDTIRSGMQATQAGVRDALAVFEIHERIAQAVIDRDPIAARRSMTVHMAMAREELRRARADEGARIE